MACQVPDVDITESVDTLQDEATNLAVDFISERTTRSVADVYGGVRTAQGVASSAERAVGFLDAIQHLQNVSQETDFEQQLRNLEMSGQLGALTEGSLIDTPGMTSFSNIMNSISAATECAQEGDGGGGGSGGGTGNHGPFRPGDLPPGPGPGHGTPFGPPPGPSPTDFGHNPEQHAPWREEKTPPVPKKDPLVLDLDGNGVTLTPLQSSDAHFDLDGDGFAEQTGWISATDGFLVRDLNANGEIDSIQEMFGTDTQNALEHLADFDSNSDGAIDSSDAVFSTLNVWIDSDQDGVTDAGELHSLASLGITSFSLSAAASGASSNGNTIDAVSTFVRNGVAEQSAAVFFDLNQTMSRYQLPPNFQYDLDAQFLPEMTGYGDVPDLRVSMSLDAQLRAAVIDLVTSSSELSYSELRDGIAQLLVMWTGSDDAVPGSRGPHFDAARLATIEAFYGTGFSQPGGGSEDPNAVSAAELDQIFESLVDFYGSMFISQAGYADAIHNADTLEGLLNPLWAFASPDYDGSLGTAAPEFQSVVGKIYGLSLAEGLDGMVSVLEQLVPWLRVTERYRFDGDDAAFDAAMLSIMDQYFNDHAIKQVWLDILDGKNVVNQQEGDGAPDVIAGDDLIDIAPGVAVAAGGNGADSYLFLATDGNASIADGGTYSVSDTVLMGLAWAQSSTFIREGDDLIIHTGLGGDVRIIGQFEAIGWNRIEAFVFADGLRLSDADIRGMLIAEATTAGDDTITGFYTSDVLQGGAGNDLMVGLSGNDTYVYALGDGQDTIRDGGIASIDVLEFAGLNFSDVTISRAGDDANDLIVSFSDGGSIRIDQQFYSTGWDTIESFVFEDQTLNYNQLNAALLAQAGTAASETIVGFTSNDTLRGRGGDDLLIGGSGDDTYVYTLGDGQDTIRDGGIASVDVLEFAGLDFSNVTFSRAVDDANDLIVSFSDGGRIRVDQQFDSMGWDRIESFVFDDLTLDVNQLSAALLDQSGTAGSETILGFSSNDVIRGRGGNDVLIGGAGDDTYYYNAGDGDDVVREGGIGGFDRFVFEDIDFSTVVFSRAADDQDDLLITLQDGAIIRFDEQFDSLAWYRIESFEFEGAAPLSHADVLGLL